MAITFFGVASQPADNSTQVGPTVTVTPPASMVAGDLIIVIGQYRGAGTVNITTSNLGGQSWSQFRHANATNCRVRLFFCRFNGTWSANPSFTVTSGTLPMTVVMHVFRPTSSTKHFILDVGPTRGTFTAGSTPFTKSITGLTTKQANTVTIAVFASVDDNTWDTLTGSGWTQSGLSAQYRNT